MGPGASRNSAFRHTARLPIDRLPRSVASLGQGATTNGPLARGDAWHAGCFFSV